MPRPNTVRNHTPSSEYDLQDVRRGATRHDGLDAVTQAALVPDVALDALIGRLDTVSGDEWDLPWQLYGIQYEPVPETVIHPAGPALGGVRVRQLIADGIGHPADELVGRIAPDGVCGLILSTEGWGHSADGRTELRLHVAMMADGRVRQHCRVRGQALQHIDDPSPLDGRVPCTLARVLGVAVTSTATAREMLLRCLATISVEVVRCGGTIAHIAAADPLTVGLSVAHSFATSAVAKSPDAARDVMPTAASSNETDGPFADWISADDLDSLDEPTARSIVAGVARATLGIPVELADWWGTEALVGQLSERVADTDALLAVVADEDPEAALHLAAVITSRRHRWADVASDAVHTRVIVGRPGRYDPCVCNTGRPYGDCHGTSERADIQRYRSPDT
jgi:hypothetical protein